MAILFLFLDGVGIGKPGAANPLDASWPAIEQLAGGQRLTEPLSYILDEHHTVRAIDATLGVDGLPQSGTGQTALLSGINAPRIAGRHYGPYPHSKTRTQLTRKNIFSRILRALSGADEPVAFANAYPDRFFSFAKRRDRWTVTTRCCLDAGVRIRGEADARNGSALTADLTGEAWHDKLNIDVGRITPEKAGKRLAAISRQHAFTLFEYFHTDKAGHSRDHDRARNVLVDIDAFVGALLEELDPLSDLLLLCSDHGNLEDLEIKTHTRNPVPLIALGAKADLFHDVTDLTGVTPAIEKAAVALSNRAISSAS